MSSRRRSLDECPGPMTLSHAPARAPLPNSLPGVSECQSAQAPNSLTVAPLLVWPGCLRTRPCLATRSPSKQCPIRPAHQRQYGGQGRRTAYNASWTQGTGIQCPKPSQQSAPKEARRKSVRKRATGQVHSGQGPHSRVVQILTRSTLPSVNTIGDRPSLCQLTPASGE